MYNCSTHHNGRNRFLEEASCTLHTIRTAAVRELILDCIKAVSNFVREDESEFIRQVRKASSIRQEETAKAHKRRLTKEQKRAAELDTLIRKIYEDKVSGGITEKRFEILYSGYEQEQLELEQSIASLQVELDGFEADGLRADQFIDLTKRYTDFSDLTPAMTNEFVDKVLVYEANKSPTGERVQRVDIYLNFIGKFDAPMPEADPEVLAEQERQREHRAKRREIERRYVQRKRQEAREQQALEQDQNQGAEQSA